MIRRPRMLAAGALLAGITLLTTACGDSSTPEVGADASETAIVETAATRTVADTAGSLKGSGASFPDAFYQEAIGALGELAPNLTVTYDAIGSSSGREQFGGGLTDFAGTDSLVKEDEGLEDYRYIPTTAASIAVVYNLPGIDELNLDGPVLADIFERRITRWDDAAITALNENVDLPGTEITVARRADGSGTTKNFTKFLESAAPQNWTLGSDDTVEWPVDTEGGQQNPGVAQIVTDAEGGIGYVDYGNAAELGLSMASIRNLEGEFIAPSIDSTRAALAGVEPGDDLTYDPLNGPGEGAYPITAPTYLLVHDAYEDAEQGAAVIAFIGWLITDGADSHAADLGYAPLPDTFRTRALEALASIDIG